MSRREPIVSVEMVPSVRCRYGSQYGGPVDEPYLYLARDCVYRVNNRLGKPTYFAGVSMPRVDRAVRLLRYLDSR